MFIGQMVSRRDVQTTNLLANMQELVIQEKLTQQLQHHKDCTRNMAYAHFHHFIITSIPVCRFAPSATTSKYEPPPVDLSPNAWCFGHQRKHLLLTLSSSLHATPVIVPLVSCAGHPPLMRTLSSSSNTTPDTTQPASPEGLGVQMYVPRVCLVLFHHSAPSVAVSHRLLCQFASTPCAYVTQMRCQK